MISRKNIEMKDLQKLKIQLYQKKIIYIKKKGEQQLPKREKI